MSLGQQHGQYNKKGKADWQMIGKHLAMTKKIKIVFVNYW